MANHRFDEAAFRHLCSQIASDALVCQDEHWRKEVGEDRHFKESIDAINRSVELAINFERRYAEFRLKQAAEGDEENEIQPFAEDREKRLIEFFNKLPYASLGQCQAGYRIARTFGEGRANLGLDVRSTIARRDGNPNIRSARGLNQQRSRSNGPNGLLRRCCSLETTLDGPTPKLPGE